jgi:hypothetical protein
MSRTLKEEIMPFNPKLSVPVSGYIDPVLVERMKRVRELKPRFSISYQLSFAVERTIDELEKAATKKVRP